MQCPLVEAFGWPTFPKCWWWPKINNSDEKMRAMKQVLHASWQWHIIKSSPSNQLVQHWLFVPNHNGRQVSRNFCVELLRERCTFIITFTADCSSFIRKKKIVPASKLSKYFFKIFSRNFVVLFALGAFFGQQIEYFQNEQISYTFADHWK